MELSILIVDDDKILVDKLEETVQWEKIGISMVFTAYNIRQAQKLLEEFPIQFLLCDIDMPQGSGLELLEWIRNNQMEIECVFLSSYANFAYAQKALRLSTREYLLKPISNFDLEMVLSRIIEETRAKWEEEAKNEETGSQQKRGKAEFWEAFFKDPSSQRELLKQAIGEKLYGEEDQILLETIKIFADDKDLNYKKDLSLFNFVIRNITSEFYEKKQQNLEAVVPVSDYEWVLVFRQPEDETLSIEVSKELREYLTKIIPQRFCVYIADARPLYDTAISWENVERMEQTILPGEEAIIQEKDLPDEENSGKCLEAYYKMPPWEIWHKSFGQRREMEGVCQDICKFLKNSYEKRCLTIEVLERFLREFEQMIYCYLGEQQMNFSRLFDSREFDKKEKEAENSLTGVIAFVVWVFEILKENCQIERNQEDVVEKVKEYINSHLSEELSRSLLAHEVYLSEDYVSKLFKATTGTSIPGYIAARRIEKAKDYLCHSGLPVSRIAMEVGYNNFSYFSKTFRDFTGMTPNEYRNQKIN